MKNYISDISFLNSNSLTGNDFLELFSNGLFEDEKKWEQYKLSKDIKKIFQSVDSKLKNRMSQLSLGIYKAIDNGPGGNTDNEEEICLFTGFGEIETTNEIVKNITIDNFSHVSPTLFHNSVHHTSLGYYTIIKEKHNPCLTISDGLETNKSFINYIKLRQNITKSIIIASGEEFSNFLELDMNQSISIVPSFTAYRIKTNSEKGFSFGKFCDSLDEIKALEAYIKAKTVVADRLSFIELKKTVKDKKILTEYPIILDNPCGLIFRLAFPFYFDIKGNSIIIEKINNKYFYFEVEI